MSKHHEDIQAYLAELKQVLQGQSAGLIQDALYDAENHLHEALLDGEQEALEDVIASYGTPTEIAAWYIKMEQDSQLFINGPGSTHSRFNGFFEPLFNLNDYKYLAYFFVAFPLSIVYFAWLALFGVPALTLSLVLLGVPLLALFLKVQTFLALFEGHVINGFLGVRMPRRPGRSASKQSTGRSIKEALISGVKSPLGWKTTFYTALQLPLSATYICVSSLLFICSLALMVTPILDPIIHFFAPEQTIDLNWYWLPLTSIVGVIGMTLSLHIARALVKLHSGIATRLLIES